MEFFQLHVQKRALLCRLTMMSVQVQQLHVDYCRIDEILIILVVIRIRRLHWQQRLDEPIQMDPKRLLVALRLRHVGDVDCPHMLMVNSHIGQHKCQSQRLTRISILWLMQTTSEKQKVKLIWIFEFLKNGIFMVEKSRWFLNAWFLNDLIFKRHAF